MRAMDLILPSNIRKDHFHRTRTIPFGQATNPTYPARPLLDKA